MQRENAQAELIRWYCPKCGLINNEQIVLYHEGLKKHKIKILPILPTCHLCGSEIDFAPKGTNTGKQKVILLTGTCASGKTTTAEMLMQRYGFEGIDGDSAMNVVKHKLGLDKLEFNGTEVFDEIVHQIDILLALQKDIVLSHVIMPGDIERYRKVMQKRNVSYMFFLLQPDYSSALARSKARTCFPNVTPEEWVRYFYDELSILLQHKHTDVVIFDNSRYSVIESADKIIQIFDGKWD